MTNNYLPSLNIKMIIFPFVKKKVHPFPKPKIDIDSIIIPEYINSTEFQFYLYNHPPKYYSNNKWHNKNLDQLTC